MCSMHNATIASYWMCIPNMSNIHDDLMKPHYATSDAIERESFTLTGQ